MVREQTRNVDPTHFVVPTFSSRSPSSSRIFMAGSAGGLEHGMGGGRNDAGNDLGSEFGADSQGEEAPKSGVTLDWLIDEDWGAGPKSDVTAELLLDEGWGAGPKGGVTPDMLIDEGRVLRMSSVKKKVPNKGSVQVVYLHGG
ncbi:kelch repeat protein [Apiospora arundinis]